MSHCSGKNLLPYLAARLMICALGAFALPVEAQGWPDKPVRMIVPANHPANNLRDFLAWAKSQGNKVSYASVGLGSSSHLSMELLKSTASFEATHVPFQRRRQRRDGRSCLSSEHGQAGPHHWWEGCDEVHVIH